MKKQKVFVNETKLKKVEIELPFYSYYQDEDSELYSKIIDKEIKQIIFYQYGKVEVINTKFNNSIPILLHINKSDKTMWEQAVNQLKTITESF